MHLRSRSQYVSFEKKDSLISPAHPVACVSFLKFCYSVLSQMFFKGIYSVVLCFICLSKIMIIIFPLVCFPFFTGFYQFSTCKCLTLSHFLQLYTALLTSFQKFVENLINCLQPFDILMISNRPFTTVPRSLTLSQIHLLIHPIIPTSCYLRPRTRFFAHKFSKYSKLLQIQRKCFFAIDLSPLAVIKVC